MQRFVTGKTKESFVSNNALFGELSGDEYIREMESLELQDFCELAALRAETERAGDVEQKTIWRPIAR